MLQANVERVHDAELSGTGYEVAEIFNDQYATAVVKAANAWASKTAKADERVGLKDISSSTARGSAGLRSALQSTVKVHKNPVAFRPVFASSSWTLEGLGR